MHAEVSSRCAQICLSNKAPARVWEPCCLLLSPSSPCVSRYYETISEVLSSVRKMEESLKRLKQARKGATAATTVAGSGAPTDDSKIRLQLALDVEYLGEQVRLCCQLNLDTGMSNYCPLSYICFLFYLSCFLMLLCATSRSRRWVSSQVKSLCSPLWWILLKRLGSWRNRISKESDSV